MSEARTHYVYLLQRGSLYKIGHSVSPQSRLAMFPVKNGHCEIIHQFPSKAWAKIERHLHAVFWRKRQHGEWFALAPVDVDLICQVLRADTVDDLPDGLRDVPPDHQSRDWGPSTDYGIIRVPHDLYQAMQKLASEGERPITWEIHRALVAHLERAGCRPRKATGGETPSP